MCVGEWTYEGTACVVENGHMDLLFELVRGHM